MPDRHDYDAQKTLNHFRKVPGRGGNHNKTNTVSARSDHVWINGGWSEGTLTTTYVGLQSFTIYNWWGKIIYKKGEDGSTITVISVEQGIILDQDGKPIFRW